ncbi:aldo/keto reductase [Clostridiaceae bacterium M8S5]|nr:aldo/keto reductase [Clostridiaceae bacterium M8S5]
MNYKKFNLVEDKLSVLGLGTWQFAGKGDWPNFIKNDAIKVIHQAIDASINFVDTAPIYGLGHSETVVGEALKGKRNKVFLATKCGLVWDDSNNVTNNLTKESLLKEIEDSLRRLQTDYVDLYQIHWPDPNTDINETFEALADIKKSGKIRYIGVSNYSQAMIKEGMKTAQVVSHQGLYNILEHNPTSYHNIPLQYKVRESLLGFLESNGQFFLPYSPLMQGLLAGKTIFDKGAVSNNPELQGERLSQHLKQAREVEETIGKPINEIALNWLIAQKTVGPVIAGATKQLHLSSNLKALEWKMNNDMIAKIDSIIK